MKRVDKCHRCSTSLIQPSGLRVSHVHNDKAYCSDQCIFNEDLETNESPWDGTYWDGEGYYVNRSVWRRVCYDFDQMWKVDPFDNDVFSMRPYYWGDDEEEAEKPNFVHKKSGLKLWWYKYPFRGAYTNKELSLKELEDIVAECISSQGKI